MIMMVRRFFHPLNSVDGNQFWGVIWLATGALENLGHLGRGGIWTLV